MADIHDTCKHVVIFHNNLSKFFKSLKGVLPEYVDQIRECISYYKSIPRHKYLEECQNLMSPHIEYISQYDDGIFTDDYQKGSLILLPKMDFRQIWELLHSDDFEQELQASTIKSIYNHLQTLYISCQMALNQIGIFDKSIEKQKEFLMNMLENLQIDDKIKERLEQMKAEEEKEGSGLAGLASLFGEDNVVYQIAKEVAEQLDLGVNDEVSNPVESIKQLFADNGKKIQEIIHMAGELIERKVASGEIDNEKMMSDAEKLKSKVEAYTGKMPAFDAMGGFRNAWDGLHSDEQSHYSSIPAILDKNEDDWSDREREIFVDYCNYLSERNVQDKPKPVPARLNPNRPKGAKPRPKQPNRSKK